ncbi:MAG TPA: hypothetical protein PK476_00715 [Candidatus Pacearchaeota archaeon]|nr:hypothetical protein [Candidatus Parcubacteria bacterium]HOC53510.1 hypothetical protein [Candidatus Pacearchaeota archaeon]HQM24416.1 hypothetical protein [Candidatus Pacearchaeota archaeon]
MTLYTIIILGIIGGIFILIITASAGAMSLKGKIKVKNHKLLALISILFLILHFFAYIFYISQ